VLPIVRFDRPRIPPRPVATVVGTPTAVRALGTPLIDATRPDAAMLGLLDGLHVAATESDWPGIIVLEKTASDVRHGLAAPHVRLAWVPRLYQRQLGARRDTTRRDLGAPVEQEPHASGWPDP